MENSQIRKSTTRNSSIEIVRIIAILFVVFSHFCVHSTFEFSGNGLIFNRFLTQIGAVGEIGVSLFVIISGYFSVKQVQSTQKMLQVLLQLWVYNVLIVGIALVAGVEITMSSLVKCLVPIYNTHWFAYAYLVLYIFMPYLNIFLFAISKEKLIKLLFVVAVIWGGIYTCTGADLGFSYLVWFAFLYIIGAYLRLHGQEKPSRKLNLVLLITSVGLLWLSTLIIDILGLKLGFFPKHGTHFYSVQSPLIWGCAICIFQLFRGITIKPNKAINTIAGTTFAVYLISDHPIIRSWLWNTLFQNTQFSDTWYLFFIGLAETVIIFVVCGIIDVLRQKVFLSKIFTKTILFLSKQIDNGFDMMQKVLAKFLRI